MDEKRAENPHRGHRERLKRQFIEHGLENLTDIQALELLLFFAIPRRDTNVLAHRLLDTFHDFRGVMEASYRGLLAVDGIRENAATLLQLVTAMNRKYLNTPRTQQVTLRSTEEVCAHVENMFRYETNEILYMLCLDGGKKLKSTHRIGEGTAARVSILIDRISRIAFSENAAYIVLAHNHLSDIAVPSKADVSSTMQLRKALRVLDIEVLDHIIVADRDSVSMRDSGFFTDF